MHRTASDTYAFHSGKILFISFKQDFPQYTRTCTCIWHPLHNISCIIGTKRCDKVTWILWKWHGNRKYACMTNTCHKEHPFNISTCSFWKKDTNITHFNTCFLCQQRSTVEFHNFKKYPRENRSALWSAQVKISGHILVKVYKRTRRRQRTWNLLVKCDFRLGLFSLANVELC